MIGDKIIYLTVTKSTNDYVAGLMKDEVPAEGTVVIAEYQNQGKGQRDSVWESEEGQNILCSIILYPHFLPISDQFALNQSVSIAIADTILHFSGVKPQIKWPNDILVNEKKIAGILIENSLRGNQFISAVVGIGLNVNQLIFKNPSYAAGSIASLTGHPIDKKECYTILFKKLDYYYDLIKQNKLKQINDHYISMLFRLDEPAIYEINGKPVNAVIRGVKPEGDLIFEMSDGRARYLKTKEVKYLY